MPTIATFAAILEVFLLVFDLSFAIDFLIRISIVYLGIFGGYAFLKSKFYTEDRGERLRQVVVNLVMPVLIFLSALDISDDITTTLLGVALFCVIIHILGYGSGLLLTRGDRYAPPTKGSILNGATFPNAFIWPFPIILALIGKEGLIAATVFLAVTFIIRNSLGVYVCYVYGENRNSQGASLRRTLKDLLLFPPLLFMIFGLSYRFLFGFHDTDALPGVDIIKMVGTLLALVIVGIRLEIPSLDKLSRDIGEVAVVRFLIIPTIGILMSFLAKFPVIVSVPIILQAWAPPAVINAVYADHFGLDTEAISQYIAVLTLFALFILPFELLLLLMLFG